MSLLSVTRAKEYTASLLSSRTRISYKSIDNDSNHDSALNRRGYGNRSITTGSYFRKGGDATTTATAVDNGYLINGNINQDDEVRSLRLTPAQLVRRREQQQAMELLYTRTFARPLLPSPSSSVVATFHSQPSNIILHNNNNTPSQNQSTNFSTLPPTQQQRLTCQFCNSSETNTTFTTEHEYMIHQMKCDSNVCAPLQLVQLQQQQLQLSTNDYNYDNDIEDGNNRFITNNNISIQIPPNKINVVPDTTTNANSNNSTNNTLPTNTLFYLLPTSPTSQQQQQQHPHENQWYNNTSPTSVLTTSPTNNNTNSNTKKTENQTKSLQTKTTTTTIQRLFSFQPMSPHIV